jgi:spore maturation protein CgeB
MGGARKSKFIPLGARASKYIEEPPALDGRDIDLVYIGKPYSKKIFRLLKLKKHFGNRMKIYGRGWKTFPKRTLTGFIASQIYDFNFERVEEISSEEFIQVYRNAKIGFNFHQSYGPSNRRMYELPINGVMQICDCKKGLSELYSLGEEVISYKNIDDAINKIEYYLKNDKERVRIAKKGYLKVKSSYKTGACFEIMIKEIEKDSKFKDL